MNFKKYQRKGLSEMVAVKEFMDNGGNLNRVSISKPDEIMLHREHDLFMLGFIARNPNNHEDLWYVSKKYFDENLEEVGEPKQERILDAPAKHNLSVIFAELKFGRPAESQEFLDRCIAVLESGEQLNHISIGERKVTVEELAMKMYDEYCACVGGKAFNGDPLPASEEFFADQTKSKQANAWRQTAVVASIFFKNRQVEKAETFFERLVREKEELAEKLEKLRSFLSNKEKAIQISGDYQYTLLQEQLKHMENYHGTLYARIEDIESKSEGGH